MKHEKSKILNKDKKGNKSSNPRHVKIVYYPCPACHMHLYRKTNQLSEEIWSFGLS